MRLDEPSAVTAALDRTRDPDRPRPGSLGRGDHAVRAIGQEYRLPVAGVEPAGDHRPAEGGRRGSSTDVIEHCGGQSTMEPALLASMFGERMEQAFGRPGAVGAVDDVDVGMERAEEPGRFSVYRRGCSGAPIRGGQTDRLLLPANRVAK